MMGIVEIMIVLFATVSSIVIAMAIDKDIKKKKEREYYINKVIEREKQNDIFKKGKK